MRAGATSGRVPVTSQFMDPTILWYIFVQGLSSGSAGSADGMESIGSPERYGVMLGTGLVLLEPNRWLVNSVNADWLRWTEM